jgi:uncharacterized tellurite resistance protein B-like protein
MLKQKERLYFVLGEFAYVVAKADGKVDEEERRKLREIVEEEEENHNYSINVARIIFHILQKTEIMAADTTYSMALKELKKYAHLLDEQMKEDFLSILHQIAEAFDPVTSHEQFWIDKLEKDLRRL